jgi:hypothetical protein
MLRVFAGCLLLLACGRTAPVKPGPLPPVYVCELSVEPRAIDFGVLAAHEHASRELLVRNVGDISCTIDAMTLSAANDRGFTLEGPTWPRIVGPDERLAVTVTFAAGEPAPPGDRRGTLEVHTDDTLEPLVNVALSARVRFCLLAARPDPLDFGNIGLNLTATRRVTLTNQGSEACDVTGLALEPGTDPNFSLPAQPTRFTIEPAASTTVAIDFAARTSAPPHLREGHLVFRSNDAVTPQGRVALSAYINTLCTEAGQYIYTVDNDGRFSRFDPLTLGYLDIAPLRCPTSATPFSMNVDQNAVAWVIFGDGNLFRVDTATGACSATAYVPNQAGFFTYGMGSTFDSATGTDTLYLAAPSPSMLGKLAFPSLTVTSVGMINLDSVELAGTGDGQLWAFAPPRGGAAVLARLDPATAAVLERYELPTVNSVGGWAIKFFGGAFYLFIGSDIWKVERTSLDPMQLNPVRPPVRVLVSPGRDIVGAGVSTCAPTQ